MLVDVHCALCGQGWREGWPCRLTACPTKTYYEKWEMVFAGIYRDLERKTKFCECDGEGERS